MINSLYIAETGLNAQRASVDIISNNIANSNTVGYKKSQINFVDLVVNSNNKTGEVNDINSLVYGVNVSQISQDFSQGPLKVTEGPLDIAIQGKGFLEVTVSEQEVGYTRVGRLKVDQDGYLTTIHGYKLTSNIVIPPDSVALVIEPDGVVKALLAGDENFSELGQIELTRFSEPNGLISQGNGVYRASDFSGEKIFGTPGEDGLGKIQQGYTEESNVSMIEEMVNLITAQRGYQLNARVVQISDQLLETINNLRR